MLDRISATEKPFALNARLLLMPIITLDLYTNIFLKRHYLFILICLLASLLIGIGSGFAQVGASVIPYRTWTSVDGRQIEGKFLGFLGRHPTTSLELRTRSARVRRQDGTVVPISRKLLSLADNQYLDQLVDQMDPISGKLWTIGLFEYRTIRTKWTNEIKVGAPRYYFDFMLDKFDSDKDGFPEGKKLILSFYWAELGTELVTDDQVKTISGQSCLGTWVINENGEMQVVMRKCMPTSGDSKLSPLVRDLRGMQRKYGSKGGSFFGTQGRRCPNTNPHAHPNGKGCACPFPTNFSYSFDRKSGYYIPMGGAKRFTSHIMPYKRAIEVAKTNMEQQQLLPRPK